MAEWEQSFGAGLPGGHRKWRYEPGMLFAAAATCWGTRRPRRLPHEGLDLKLCK